MKQYLYHIGIDISKSKLDAVILRTGGQFILKHMVVENNEKGIFVLFDYLRHNKIPERKILFCCEHTGVYTNNLIDYLSNEKADFWVVNSLEMKRSRGIVRTKNDKSDARGIAEYSMRNLDKLRLYKPAQNELIKLGLLMSERSKIGKAIQLFSYTKENKGFMSTNNFSEVENLNLKILGTLKAHLKDTDKKIQSLIKKNKPILKLYNLITTVPGIGPSTAIYFIVTTRGFEIFESWRKYACYAGVAPFEYSSGSSVKKPTRIHYLGNKKMKSLLAMCAISTLKGDAQMKQYFKRKKAEGKSSRLVINNIKCKLISRVFAVVRRGTPYAKVSEFAG